MPRSKNRNEEVDISSVLLTPYEKEMLLKTLLKKSYYEFFKYFWKTVEHNPLSDNWHIKYLCDEMQYVCERVHRGKQNDYDLLINMPPATSKSSLCNKFLIPWCWAALSPSMTFMTVSYGEKIIKNSAIKSKDIIESAEYKKLFPEVKIRADAESALMFRNTLGGFRMSSPIGGQITGEHADMIIVDDPLSVEGAKSISKRKKANDVIKETLPSRRKLQEVSTIIYTFQRTHDEDPGGFLSTNDHVKHICLPAKKSDKIRPYNLATYYDDQDGYLEPGRLPQRYLDDIRNNSELAYYTQYQQETSIRRGNILQEEWFDNYLREDQMPKGLTFHFIVDSAITSDIDNDPTGLIAYAMDTKGRYYLYNHWKTRGEPLQVADQINKLAKDRSFCPYYDYVNSYVTVEGGSSTTGRSLISSIETVTPLNVSSIPYINTETDSSKSSSSFAKLSKEERVRSMSGRIRSGKVFLIDHENVDWSDFIKECKDFPQSKHDEYPDLLAYIIAMDVYKNNYVPNSKKTKGDLSVYFSIDVTDSDHSITKKFIDNERKPNTNQSSQDEWGWSIV